MSPWAAPVWLLAVFDVFAVHRLTRLVTKDDITQPIRERIIAWTYRHRDPATITDCFDVPPLPNEWQRWATDDEYAPKLATLITCRWCAGAWIVAAVVTARALIPSMWGVAAYGLALASAAVFVAGMEADD